ncbi:transcription factor SPT20-like protein [Leptotrombidium deliense]|uniref:Transcription factor SPT20-like protein n=1 Tax=Leptotrombidium deliense TaxID=299467 RepID=A0A443SAF5_9ACAR|nr:transcription factor SPT20-like protein [Leptotrombidium deliense]
MQINNGNENSNTNDNDDFFEENDKSARVAEPTTPATNGHQNAKKVDLKNEKQVLKETEKEDVAILKPFPKSLPLQATSCPISCIASCAPRTDTVSDGSLSIVETANALECGDFVKDFASFETIVQNLMDLSTNGYTLFLPTNNAYSRLPKNLIDHFKKNPMELNQLIENHFIMSSHTLEDMRIASQLEPRAMNAKLRITSTNDLGVTVNGQRLVSANQKGPQSGVIHTIDGLLYPIANKDIMQTLKSCNRFDGFVTLADGTGISDILSKGGPYSVFVPSNEALQKIPDSDLNKIRSNLTALKGNLVEANVSPLYRADIPASNGVIHVLDWILKPEDHDWCENILLPR